MRVLLVALWALVTLLVFVPAGALLAYTQVASHPIRAAAIATTVLSGVVYAFLHGHVASHLARGSASATQVRRAAYFGVGHHVAVAVLIVGATAWNVDDALATAPLLGVPAAIGLGVAWLVHAAPIGVGSAQREGSIESDAVSAPPSGRRARGA